MKADNLISQLTLHSLPLFAETIFQYNATVSLQAGHPPNW